MSTVPPIRDQKGREAAAKMLVAVRRHRDENGGVVIATPRLREWLKRDGRDMPGADPDGFHLARRILLHNDRDWRLEVHASTVGSSEPTMLVVDVTMDDWEAGRHDTDLLIARLHDLLN